MIFTISLNEIKTEARIYAYKGLTNGQTDLTTIPFGQTSRGKNYENSLINKKCTKIYDDA